MLAVRGKALGTAQEIGPYSFKRCRELKGERTLDMHQIETTANYVVQHRTIHQLGTYIGSYGSNATQKQYQKWRGASAQHSSI